MKTASPLHLVTNKKGQGLTEYLILLILVSVACISATQSLGGRIKQKIKTATKNIHNRVVIEY